LSKISRKDLIYEEVDISLLAEASIADYRHDNPETKASVNIQPDIKVFADKALIRDVLGNLIDNSWKFSANKPESQISVKKCVEPGYEGFSVEDNGIGFRKEDEDKLFKVFSRLHSDAEYKGTGVGLATIQRIVQRHDGIIRAESEEGVFAKFTVLLPRRQDLSA
jgi:signal transduction histidine kinase